MDQDAFNEEARFAKIVETEKGPAVMIARHVFHITGPAGTDPVELFSRAFRQMSGPNESKHSAIFGNGHGDLVALDCDSNPEN